MSPSSPVIESEWVMVFSMAASIGGDVFEEIQGSADDSDESKSTPDGLQ
jgi:hypothetical protein